ncbi:hypothetical protein KAJ61_02035 [Candidatus Parcubacteria bacterium]|nr:hypothetical protein [Candidatus Parcubacteria bacterium]
MEKPKWVKRLEIKILDIAGIATTYDKFWVYLNGYCKNLKISVEILEQEK